MAIEELAMTQHYLDGINVKLLDTLTISFLVPEIEMCLPFFFLVSKVDMKGDQLSCNLRSTKYSVLRALNVPTVV